MRVCRASCEPGRSTKHNETMPERLPKNTCDTHLHIFGDARTYPAGNPHALYRPPEDCTFAAMQAMHEALGVDRAVFVQPTIYGTDHRLMHDALKGAPRHKYRGVAIIDDSVSDAELARLDSVGVRGARFNFGGNFRLAPSLDGFRRGLAAFASSAGSLRFSASATTFWGSNRSSARSIYRPSSITWAALITGAAPRNPPCA